MSAETSDLGEFELIRRFFRAAMRDCGARSAHAARQSGVVLGIGDDAALLAAAAGHGIGRRRRYHRGGAAFPARHRCALDRPSRARRQFERHGRHGRDARLGDAGADPAERRRGVAGAILRGTFGSRRRPRGGAGRRRHHARSPDRERANSGTRSARHGAAPQRRPRRGSVGGDRHLGRCRRGTCISSAHRRRGARRRPKLVPPSWNSSGASTIRCPGCSSGWRRAALRRAAMDLSDGLVGDLPKLAQASGLAAHVAVERLPLSDAMRAAVPLAQARDWALAAGDDYELLLAVPAARLAELEAAAAPIELNVDPDRRIARRQRCDVVAKRRGFRARRAQVTTTSPKPRPKSQFRSGRPVSSASIT